MSTNARTVRLFLSSTFRDFDEERQLLVQQVFPALRIRLRSRFVELVDIDLRWGISPEHAEQGHVLSICLDEIDQCRPYFIGLLGERYGWVPAHEEYPTELAESHPWLKDHRGSASVTELEIRYGVLDNLAMRDRALFFFRDPAYAERQGGVFVAGETDRVRQASLKGRIRELGLPVYDYRNPEELAMLLGDRLWALLDSEFPAAAVPDAHGLENLSHLSFAAVKLGPRFVRDPVLSQRLANVLEEGHQRVLVTGPAGIGKTTLLTDWGKGCSASQSIIVLQHFLEASAESTGAIDLLRRIFELIRRETQCDDPVPDDRKGLLKGLPQWLATAHAHSQRTGTRWSIVLDGLDRLRTERDLMWLPTFIPESIQLIVSCRPGPVRSALRRRGQWQVFEVEPMQPGRRREFLQGQLAVFKKKLNEPQLAAIANHACADQPLFLCALAEELRVYGSFEGLQGHLDELLSSAEIDDIYERTLARLEACHDPSGVKRALSGLCLSQSGLTEEEVLAFSGLSFQACWSPIRLALGEALFYAAGRVRPAHEHLRKAVRDRYYAGPDAERACRLELADWFGKQPLDSRRAWEQPAQLAMAGAHEQLLTLLCEREIFEQLHRVGGNERLYRYWVDIEESTGVAPESHYAGLWPTWRRGLAIDQRLDVSGRIERFLRHGSLGGEFALNLAHERLQDCREAYGESDVRYLKQMGACAVVLSRRKDRLEEARRLAEQACEGIERVSGTFSVVLAEQLLNLARICLKQRDAARGVDAARRSLSIQEATDGPEHPSLVHHLNCLTDHLLVKAGKARVGEDGKLWGGSLLQEAMELQARCLRILKQSRGADHLDSAACFVRTGQVFNRARKPDMAAQAFKKALETRTRLLGAHHPLTRSASRLLEGLQ